MVESEELKSTAYSPIQIEIINLLKQHEPMTRDDICREMGFGTHIVEYITHPNRVQRDTVVHIIKKEYDKRTTVFDNLAKLEKRKIVGKFSRNNGKRGRPLILWHLRGD